MLAHSGQQLSLSAALHLRLSLSPVLVESRDTQCARSYVESFAAGNALDHQDANQYKGKYKGGRGRERERERERERDLSVAVEMRVMGRIRGRDRATQLETAADVKVGSKRQTQARAGAVSEAGADGSKGRASPPP